MRTNLHLKWLAAFITLLTGMTPLHAAPKQLDIDEYRALVQLDKRLETTGYRLANANAPFCADKWRNPGWVLHSYRQYPDRETAGAAFAFPTPVAVAAIVDGGPAQVAGVKTGFGLYDMPGGISFGGEATRHKRSSEVTDMINLRFRKMFESSAAINIIFRILEGSASDSVSINLDPPFVCASHFTISSGGKLDAGADGETVRISAKLAEFTPDEDEFAFIVAHELSHNILRHRERLDAANVKRGVGRMFGKSKKMIRNSEVEADKLALWLMANAGYNPAAALSFIERFGRKHGKGFFADGTHYRWKKRQKIMTEELAVLQSTARGPNGYLSPLLKQYANGNGA